MDDARNYGRGPDAVGVNVEGAAVDGPAVDGAAIDGATVDGPAVDGPEPDGSEPDVPGLLMRVRRTCDLSQRDLGDAIGLDHAQVARIESARRRVDLSLLARVLSLAGMRIAILDLDGIEVLPVARDVLRDKAGRRMPAHLDVLAPSERSFTALLDAHSARPVPQAGYRHRTGRDQRRVMQDPGATPDQPTSSSLAQLERDRRLARLHDVRQRVATLLDPDCACPGECWEGRRCVDACTCRCEC